MAKRATKGRGTEHERGRAEQGLLRNEGLFLSLVETAPDAIVIVDQDGRIVLANSQTEKLFGYSRDELLGKPVEILVPKRLRKAHAGHRANYISSPDTRPMGTCLDLAALRKDGSEFVADISLSAVETDDGVLVTSTVRDVTDRRRMQQALRARECQQAAVAELGQRALAGAELSTLMDEAVALVGQTLGVEYSKVLELLPDGEALLLRAGVGWKEGLVGRATVGADTNSQAGYTLLSSEPVIVEDLRTEVRFSGPPLLREHGIVSGMSVIIHGRDRPFGVLGAHTTRRVTFTKDDVHFLQSVANVLAEANERKRAEQALRESEEWISTTLRSIGDAVIATDAKGRVRFLNPAAQAMTGWNQAEAFGKPLRKVFNIVREDTGRPAEDPVTKVTRDGLVVGLANHTVLIARDGTRRPVDDSGSPIRDSQGNIIGIVLVFHDITEQKQASEELRRLTARLLEVEEEDRRQVAYDIHDGLGQMITAAAMHLEAFSQHRQEITTTAGAEEFGKAKRCLQDAVVEMRRLVSELGPLLLEDVGLVEASRRLLADMAERMNWQTEFQGGVCLERLDRMAEMALYRIVQEALANVAKHAKTEKVRIEFRPNNDVLQLEVRDWGKGFDVGKVLGQSAGGGHVGLLGMRERAVLIGGELKIESAQGKGTRLTVSAPMAPPTAQLIGRKKVEVVNMVEAKKCRESARKGITVLIADDHPMVREGLRSMLDADGIEIIGEAANGAEAVEKAQQFNPDVVLMDVRMPDMDGLAATEIVKQGSPETSVIVVTSYESKDYLRRALEAGASGYILKGMSRDRLIEAIRLVRGGGSLIDARLLSDLLREMGVEGSRFKGAEGVLEALSPREREVLQLLVGGLTNKAIASEMHYSVGTVKNVVQRVIEKLGVSDRTQAAVYAVRAGLNPPP